MADPTLFGLALFLWIVAAPTIGLIWLNKADWV
jgi:hypothetical protein